MSRSQRPDVRNPLLRLPAAAGIQKLSPEVRDALRALLKDLAADARRRGDECWGRNKCFLAAYWRTVAVYANHASRLCRPAVATTEPASSAEGA